MKVTKQTMARFQRRGLGFCIDIMMIVMVFFLISLFFSSVSFYFYQVIVSIGFCYFIFGAMWGNGQTIGKYALMIKIVSVKGKLRLSQLMIRYVVLLGMPVLLYLVGLYNNTVMVAIVFAGLFVGSLSILWVAFLKKDFRALHDILAGTNEIEIPPKKL